MDKDAINIQVQVFVWHKISAQLGVRLLNYMVKLCLVFKKPPNVSRVPVLFFIHASIVWDFLGGTSGKEPICQCRRHKRHGFSPWVRKILWRKAWQPTPVFLPGKSHGQRSLAATVHQITGSDMTEVTKHAWMQRRQGKLYQTSVSLNHQKIRKMVQSLSDVLCSVTSAVSNSLWLYAL